jgi:predicted CoA-binding protein
MVVGASNNRSKFGNKAVRAYSRHGHVVIPVNLREDRIEGIAAWRDVRDAPGPIDRVLFYVPPDVGVKFLERLAERGDVGELWLNPGSESDELIGVARRLGFDPIQACAIVNMDQRP